MVRIDVNLSATCTNSIVAISLFPLYFPLIKVKVDLILHPNVTGPHFNPVNIFHGALVVLDLGNIYIYIYFALEVIGFFCFLARDFRYGL